MGQPQVSRHQTRLNEGLNRQYSPNIRKSISIHSRIHSRPRPECYINGTGKYQVQITRDDGCSPKESAGGFQELTRASRDKANDSLFTAIKFFDGTNRQAFEDWIDEVNQACRASNRGFRTELFKKSAEAVRQVILSCEEFSDEELVAKLRSCFSHAPTMNEAREELRNMRQMEHESISVYMYRWGRALYRSSEI